MSDISATLKKALAFAVPRELERANPEQTTIVVGMSGGVDSSVTAALLKERGFRVIGLFMKNWDDLAKNEGAGQNASEPTQSECEAAADYDDVARVCETIGIPYFGVNFTKEYWDQVFQEFLRDYKSGFTPNPDVLCNREIKFKSFFEKIKELGGQYLATGHYCQLEYHDHDAFLLKGADPGKDQSYFLSLVEAKTLRNVIFPIGHLLKSEVRSLAEHYGLATKNKKDSTGICFIGERKFPKFLADYIKPKKGPFKTLDETTVGTHQGVPFYTYGQRRGLGLGGQGERWFVVRKDVGRNVVYVERGENHPALFCDDLELDEMHWIASPEEANALQFPLKCKAKTRYRQDDQDCVVELTAPGKFTVRFAQPQRAVTERQALVLYLGERCLGGGPIRARGQTYFEKGLQLPKNSTPEC